MGHNPRTPNTHGLQSKSVKCITHEQLIKKKYYYILVYLITLVIFFFLVFEDILWFDWMECPSSKAPGSLQGNLLPSYATKDLLTATKPLGGLTSKFPLHFHCHKLPASHIKRTHVGPKFTYWFRWLWLTCVLHWINHFELVTLRPCGCSCPWSWLQVRSTRFWLVITMLVCYNALESKQLKSGSLYFGCKCQLGFDQWSPCQCVVTP